MAPQPYTLNFNGYWDEGIAKGIPSKSGVYCVYACKSNQTVSIRKLLYIGEAEDVNGRIAKHEKWPDWRKHLNKEEQVCFNFAPVESSECERVECAMIFHHKPPENTDCKDAFAYDETTISTSGRNSLLTEEFTVKRTQ